MTRQKNIAVMLLFILIAVPSFADNTAERQFIWKEANSIMASARTPKEFLAAAEAYRKLVDAGVRNGPLFYNLGTALLMAERYDDAMTALLRAERYMGTNWDIRRNMLIAAAGTEKDETASLPWYRTPLFWHYGLSCSSRMTITVCAFTALWLAVFFRIIGFPRFSRRIMMLSLIVLALWGSSTMTSIHQEREVSRHFSVSNSNYGVATPL